MANIYEIHAKTHISLRTLKKLDRLGFLVSEEIENPEVAKMICALQKGNRLSVAHRVMLIDQPPLLFELDKYVSERKRADGRARRRERRGSQTCYIVRDRSGFERSTQ